MCLVLCHLAQSLFVLASHLFVSPVSRVLLLLFHLRQFGSRHLLLRILLVRQLVFLGEDRLLLLLGFQFAHLFSLLMLMFTSVSFFGRAAGDNSRLQDNYTPGSAFGRSSSRSQEKLTKCSSGSSSAYSGSKRDAQFFSSLHSEFPRRNGRGRVRAHVSLLVAGIFPCVFPKVVILVDRCLSPPLVCATPPWVFLRLLMLE